MKIFILEDDPIRLLYFREQFIRHDLTITDTITRFDLFQPPYDVIFMDHDLGGRQLQDHEDNGAAFAKLMVKHEAWVLQDLPIIIHSYNAHGAMNIQAEIPNSVYCPFRGPAFTRIVDQIK